MVIIAISLISMIVLLLLLFRINIEQFQFLKHFNPDAISKPTLVDSLRNRVRRKIAPIKWDKKYYIDNDRKKREEQDE